MEAWNIRSMREKELMKNIIPEVSESNEDSIGTWDTDNLCDILTKTTTSIVHAF